MRSETTGGALVAVVGPSGAGKDTILSLARKAVGGNPAIHFARRIVTRTASIEDEDHDCLDEAGFDAAEAAGAFCLSWRAHGLRYGLPATLLQAYANGQIVVANLSRRALAQAAGRFARLHVVEISVPREVLVRRIAARGRETPAEIEARLSRSVVLDLDALPGASLRRLDNSGPAEAAASDFVEFLNRLADLSAAKS